MAELEALEAAEARALQTALGPWAADLDAAGWAIATLPTRFGGLGLRSPTAESFGYAERTLQRVNAAEADDWRTVVALKQAAEKSRDSEHDITLRALAQVLPDGDVVRLFDTHETRANAALDLNANTRDGTLLPPKVAHAFLAQTLALAPLGKDANGPCGVRCATEDPWQEIGDADDRARHHPLVCKRNLSKRHTRLARAIVRHAADLRDTSINLQLERDVDPITGQPVDRKSVV